MRGGRWQRWWLGVAGLGGFLVLLEVAPRAGLVPERYLPPTSRVAGALADELGRPSFWTALGDTLEGWAIGLAVAVAAGVGLGLLQAAAGRLRVVLAGAHPGPARHPGRRPGGHGHRPQLPARPLGPHPPRGLAHDPALCRHRLPPGRRGRAGAGGHGRADHRQPRAGQGDRRRPDQRGRARDVRPGGGRREAAA